MVPGFGLLLPLGEGALRMIARFDQNHTHKYYAFYPLHQLLHTDYLRCVDSSLLIPLTP